MSQIRGLFRLIRDHRHEVRFRKRLEEFHSSGQKPWTTGYDDYKEMFITGTLQDKDLLDRFSHDVPVPLNYGFRLDERVVEYPWLFSRLENANRLLLDAGSALNFPYLLDLPALKTRNVVIYTLSPESILSRGNISYIYGDLRQTILKSECFDEIVCISTLEHIGMDNTALYSTDNNFAEFRPNDYQIAVKEFYRLMKPGGKLYITVPYGRYFNHGWLQVFDEGMVDNITQVFNGSNVSKVYYRYLPEGWQISTADECAQCDYFDIHNQPHYDSDYAAAARAVVCMEMVK
jgi:SAM-dependent methyltransferase